MSDHYTVLVIQNTQPDTTTTDAEKIKNYLIGQNFINESMSPGVHYKKALQYDDDDHVLDLSNNQVEIHQGRKIFHEMEGAEFRLTCRGCGQVFNGFESPVIEVIDGFDQGENEIFTCPDCGATENLRFANTQGFAAGFLGVEFWNWGYLKKEFIEQIAVLMNSKVIVIEGHL